jgi:hypothetical protein
VSSTEVMGESTLHKYSPPFVTATIILNDTIAEGFLRHCARPVHSMRRSHTHKAWLYRFVMNKATGKPKGTAFVEFQTAEAAKAAVAASDAQRSGQGAGVSLKGKALCMDAALVQDRARELANSQVDASGRNKDKRNLYLVWGCLVT